MLLEFPLGKSALKLSGNGMRVLRGMACGSLENLGRLRDILLCSMAQEDPQLPSPVALKEEDKAWRKKLTLEWRLKLMRRKLKLLNIFLNHKVRIFS